MRLEWAQGGLRRPPAYLASSTFATKISLMRAARLGEC
jgi:hypothetical protein